MSGFRFTHGVAVVGVAFALFFGYVSIRNAHTLRPDFFGRWRNTRLADEYFQFDADGKFTMRHRDPQSAGKTLTQSGTWRASSATFYLSVTRALDDTGADVPVARRDLWYKVQWTLPDGWILREDQDFYRWESTGATGAPTRRTSP